MKQLSMIPLPLRIAAMFLIGLVIFKLVGSVSSTIFFWLAVVLWTLSLMTWAYDQGWLNPLARVPVLSNALGFLSNRAAITVPQEMTTGDTPEGPPGELNDTEREKLFSSALERLSDLRGNDDSKDLLLQRIIDPARSDPESPFGSTAPAGIILISGPRGVGKTTIAKATASLLAGVSATKTATIVNVRETDLRTGEFSSAIEMARRKVRSARGGTLLLDDADWLLNADPYGGVTSPGLDFGNTLVQTVSEFPKEVSIIATLSPTALERLTEDANHGRWLGKLARREVLLEDLGDDALLEVLERELNKIGWELDDDDADVAARRLLSDLCDRKAPNFDNAIACRRTAETLVEITSEEFEEKAANSRIGREAIRRADEVME